MVFIISPWESPEAAPQPEMLRCALHLVALAYST